MPAKNTKKQKEPDWEAVAKDYVPCVLTLDQICDKHSKKGLKLNKSRLLYQMKKRGYREAREKVKAGLKGTSVPTEPTTDVIVQQATASLLEVTRQHVEELGQLRNVSSIMLENIRRSMESVAGSNGNNSNIIMPAFLGERETVADYLKKLTEVCTKTIQLERACLGLDKDTPDEEEKTYEDRLQELYESEPPALPLPDNVIDGEFKEVKEQ